MRFAFLWWKDYADGRDFYYGSASCLCIVKRFHFDSYHERSELRKPSGLPRAFFLFFISYMKLRYENAKMYSLWPGNALYVTDFAGNVYGFIMNNKTQD